MTFKYNELWLQYTCICERYQWQNKYMKHLVINNERSNNLSIHVELNIFHTGKRGGAQRDGRDDLVTSQYCAREGGSRSWAVNHQIIIRDRLPRSRANICARDIRPDLSGNAIEADGNLIPRRGRSSIAGPNRVREVAELNFEGSYIYL